MKKITMIFSLILMMAVESQAGTCTKTETAALSNSWARVTADQNLNPTEGTYLGKGRTTGQAYFMHLLSFHGRTDLFTAVVENRDTEKAWLGVLERADNGVFNWRNIIVGSKSEDGTVVENKTIGIDFIQAPLFRYEYELNRNGEPDRFVGTSLDPSSDVEAVAYDRIRSNRLSEEIGMGVWRRGGYSLTVIPQPSTEECPGPRSYSAKEAQQSAAGAAHAIPLELRPSIFAGIYTAHTVQQSDYERRAKRDIQYLIVNVTGYKDGWRSKKKSYDRVLVFRVGADLLPQSDRLRLVR